jgi:fructokinase
VRAATLHAVELAHRYGVTVSYDPNLRLSLWPDADAARAGMRLGLAHADIVKIGEEEVDFLTSACDTIEGARSLWHPRLQLMAVTRGTRGCLWLNPETQGEQPGFKVAAIDTTGAGDAFMAGLLAGLVYHPERMGDAATLGRAIRFANAAGALTTTKRGAIPSLPDRATVEHFLAEQDGAASQRFSA